MKITCSTLCKHILASFCVASSVYVYSDDVFTTPTMGWSSWNTYHVNISDSLITGQADAMVRLGLKDAGYRYINIDDGFFGGRDSTTGQLLVHPVRFPGGLKPVADHIHALGLKAGIYSDAGKNTCGNFFDNDSIAVGVGLYGHEAEDAEFFFNDCGFDFIKIDFCGGVATHNTDSLALDECERYTAIRKAIDSTGRSDIRMNICRWDYPGTWVSEVGDSWRISHDIRPRWSSVKDIINQNLYLSAYAGNGRYNDMDMLEVGRGMTPDEDNTHFALWCIMSSPLLIGCDLNTIKPQTLDLLLNGELIALNQDKLGKQAYVAKNDAGVYLLVKDIESEYGNVRAAAIYNSTDSARNFTFDFSDVDLAGDVAVRDLVRHSELGIMRNSAEFDIAPHASVILRLDAETRLTRSIYEAETAFLSKYSEITNPHYSMSAFYERNDSCSGGMVVSGLGMSVDNDLQWRDIYVPEDGMYNCTLAVVGDMAAPFVVNVNGVDVHTVESIGDLSMPVKLDAGKNTIRLYTNEKALMPDMDYLKLDVIQN